MWMRIILLAVLMILTLGFTGELEGMSWRDKDDEPDLGEELKTLEQEEEEDEDKVDDWILAESIEEYNAGRTYSGTGMNPQAGTVVMGKTAVDNAVMSMRPEAENLGFSVGGAKDIDNFRDNIANGYLPLPSSITYEGLFYDYYFDTGQSASKGEAMFSPSYTVGRFGNVRTEESELWLSVGLNSNIKESDFRRKKLNLVVVLDVSGSMSSPFDQYYYDGKHNRDEEEWDRRSKLEIARETICDMLDHLQAGDRFGMAVFENQAFIAKPLNPVGKTNMEKIKGHIRDLHAMGGTNMYAGMQKGTELFDELKDVDREEYENRIIFLTDAMPNRELTDKYSLWGVLKENAETRLYSTLIGVGVDFQTELVEAISKVEGANYYSIHSAEDFKQRLDEEFEFMVTPLVFNLNLVLEADGYRIKRVCGTPYSAEQKGEILKVGTLFPSRSEDGEVKGGIILVELEQTAESGAVRLMAGYDDRSGEHHKTVSVVDMQEYMLSSSINYGIKKGVLLVHYADLLREWVLSARSGREPGGGEDDWLYQQVHYTQQVKLGEWEQTSMELSVSEYYRGEFAEFKKHLEHEIRVLGDESLRQEVDLINEILN